MPGYHDTSNERSSQNFLSVGDARGVPGAVGQQDARAPGGAIDHGMRRRIGDAGGQQRRPRGRQHAQRVDREVADRDRDGHDAAGRQRAQVGGERLHGERGGVGLGGVEEVGRQVDDVVTAAVAHRRDRALARQRDALVVAPGGRRPEAVLQRAQQHRLGLQHAHMRGAERQQSRRCGSRPRRRPAARSRAGSADTAARPAPRRRSRRRARPGFGSAAMRLPSRYRPKRLRRARHAQHAGVVGDVGVDALGEVVEQQVVAARRQHARDHARVGRVQRRVDRLEVVELRPGCRAAAAPRRRAARWPPPPAPAQRQRPATKQALAASGTSSSGTRKNACTDEHRRQHQRRAGAGAGQVVAIDLADAVGVQHEAQADEHAGEEEERQQAGVVAGDIPELRLPGRRVLQLQRIERVGGGEVEADRRRGHQQRRQRGQQRLATARERVAEQRQDHAAEREPGHHDGDDPVAVFRPLRDGEVAGQRRLVSHRGQRHEEQRQQSGAPHVTARRSAR